MDKKECKTSPIIPVLMSENEERSVKMRTLRSLTEQCDTVWFCCDTQELQKLFLRQCVDEGFLTMNGDKPTELNCNRLYGISNNSVGYLMGMCWELGYRGAAIDIGTDKRVKNPVRVDYGKYMAGDEDYLYHYPNQLKK